MKRLVAALGAFAIGGITQACDVAAPPTAPISVPSHARLDRLLSLPTREPYVGVITPGRFVICTSLFSPVAVYRYTIEVVAALPSDRFVTEISEENGECVAAFDTNRRGGPEPVIRVYADPYLGAFAHDIWDWQSLFEGFVDGKGFISRREPGDDTTLQGFEGALVKFYYHPADLFGSFICPASTGISIQGTCEAGGHGGTGTLDFSEQ